MAAGGAFSLFLFCLLLPRCLRVKKRPWLEIGLRAANACPFTGSSIAVNSARTCKVCGVLCSERAFVATVSYGSTSTTGNIQTTTVTTHYNYNHCIGCHTNRRSSSVLGFLGLASILLTGNGIWISIYTSAFSIDEELPAGPVAAIAIVSATVAIMTMAFGLHLFCCGSLSRIARGMEGKQSPANFRLI